MSAPRGPSATQRSASAWRRVGPSACPEIPWRELVQILEGVSVADQFGERIRTRSG
jgi:hypothetical protein